MNTSTAAARIGPARIRAIAAAVILGLAVTGCGSASSGAESDPAGIGQGQQGTVSGDIDPAGGSGADDDPDDADGPVDPEDVASGAAEDADEVAEEPTGTGTLPDGWPEAVQLVPGTIIDGFAVGGGQMMVTVALPEGGRAAFDAGVDLLERAGHTEVFRLDEDELTQSGNWTGDGYSVTFNVSTTDGEWIADYVVSMTTE